MKSLHTNDVFTFVPSKTFPAGMKAIASRWLYKVKADNTFKGTGGIGMGARPGHRLRQHLRSVGRLQSIRVAVMCSNMMVEFGLGKAFHSVPVHIDKRSTLYVAGDSTYEWRTKYSLRL